MAVADEAAGWAEALRRIEACRETWGEGLGLGGLQVKRVPGGGYGLGGLRRLSHGADAEARNEPYFGLFEEDDKRCNAREHPDVQERLAWFDPARVDASGRIAFALLPQGLLRTVMAAVGERAGRAGTYWRDGFAFYD